MNKKLLSILLTMLLLVSSFQYFPNKVEANGTISTIEVVPFGQFTTGNDGWSAYLDGSTGGAGADLVLVDTEMGKAVKLPNNFGESYQFGFIEKAISDLVVEKVSFQVSTNDVKNIRIRMVDATGQIHQHIYPLVANGEWETVELEELASAGSHWGGAGDGAWHGPATKMSIIADKADRKDEDLASIEVLIKDIALHVAVEQEVPVDFDNVISDFEQPSDYWHYGYGDQPGVQGSFNHTDVDVYKGTNAGQLKADFTEGNSNYVSMFKEIDELDVAKVAFWIKTTDFNAVGIRMVDATGQIFQQKVALKQTDQWQQVVVDQLRTDHHWSGAEDGVWHNPLSGMYILLDRDDLKAGLAGEILVDQVTAQMGDWKPELKINQTTLGNVFVPNEQVKFLVETRGDVVKWTVTDVWGNDIKQGDAVVALGNSEIMIDQIDQGYYLLHVDAYEDGVVMKKSTTSFAVLDQLLALHDVEQSPFGAATHFGQSWSPDIIPLIQKAGIKHVRDELYWSNIEQEKGVFTFPSYYDRYMNILKEQGIDPLIVFSFNNDHYDGGVTPYTDEGRAAFANYGIEILKHYADQVKDVEVYNEYNIEFSTGPGAKKPEYYFQMLKETYNQVKEYDEEVTVVGPVASQIPWNWLEQLFQQQDEDGSALDYMDAVSVHPYRYPTSPEGMDDEMIKLQQLIQQYNNGNKKPIWITEWGWPTHQGSRETSELMQAAYLVRSSVQLLSENVERLYWYDFMNDGTDIFNSENNFGIIRHQYDELGKYTPKPAYVSYATMTRALTGANFKQQDEIADDIYSYQFAKDNEVLRLMWSKNPTPVTILADEAIVVTDMVGSRIIYEPVDGKITYSLSEYPVYITGTVNDVVAGGMFSLAAEDAYVGSDITVTLTIDNREHNQELTGYVVIGEQQYNFTVPANEREEKRIQINGFVSEGERTIHGEVFVNNQLMGSVSTLVHVIDPIAMKVKHVVVEGEDKLRLSVTNHAPIEHQLESIVWTIGEQMGTTAANLLLQGQTTTVYDLALPIDQEGTYMYQLQVMIDSYPIITSNGKLVLIDEQKRTPIMKSTTAIKEPTIILESDGNYNNLTEYGGKEDLSGAISLYWDEQNLYLTANITDDTHQQLFTGSDIWNGDSIQFALSDGNPGESIQNYEYGMALTPSGPQLYSWSSMDGVATGLHTGDGMKLSIDRNDNSKQTLYELSLPWSKLRPITPEDSLFSFSIIVNDDDGAGRRGWVEWGAGIGGAKGTVYYKPMEFVDNSDGETPPVSYPPYIPTPHVTEPSTEDGTDTEEEENVEEANDAFSDVANHWALSEINRAVQQGIINGYPDGSFRPNDTITRAEFVMMLDRTLQLPASTNKWLFVDDNVIPQWAKPAIYRAVEAGIVRGYSDERIGADRAITREEMAVMIARAAAVALTDIANTTFIDDDRIHSWAKPAIAAVTHAELMIGREANQFAPQALTTRAEAVVVILRLLDME